MSAVGRTVVFRVDASNEIGSGHAMRCLALADVLKVSGSRCHFISRHMPEYLTAQLDKRGHAFTLLADSGVEPAGGLLHSAQLGTSQRADAEQTLRALSGERCDWLAVDHYALDAKWESVLRKVASRIMVIDDLADRVHDCDLLLDQTASVNAHVRYDGKVPEHCHRLIGVQYALLREEFNEMRGRIKERNGQVKRILIFMGGMDARGGTMYAIDALRKAGADGLRVDIVIGPQNPHLADIQRKCDQFGFSCYVQTHRIAELMASADLAIGAGGTATWERCCLGLPTLVLCVAENQRWLIDQTALLGLVYAPSIGSTDVDSIAEHLRALRTNPRLLRALSRNCLQAVDGHGTWRVARAMGSGTISIREANQTDAAQVLAWRNHPEIRAASNNAHVIEQSAHDKWYCAVLDDADRFLLLGEDDKGIVGVVRFDVRDGEAEVSIYLVPGRIGRGYGAGLLQAAEAWLSAKRPDVPVLKAQVLRDNPRSHGLFESCGYKKSSTLYVKRIEPI